MPRKNQTQAREVYRLDFPTLDAYTTHAETKARTNRYEKHFDKSFTGTRTLADAAKLAREGWPEGLAKVSKITDAMVTKITSLIDVPVIQYDVTGLDYDMGMYLSETPESWYDFHTETREGNGQQQIRLVFSMSVSGGVSTEVIEARGATVAGLVLALEAAGKRVEVIGKMPLRDSNSRTDLISVVLKQADQPLDLDRLIFALVHPAMFRRLGFAVIDSIPDHPNGFDVGMPIEVPENERGDIYVGMARYSASQWLNPESAQAWILERLKEQGIALHESKA